MGAVHVGATPEFGPKAQWGGMGTFGASFTLASWLDMAVSVEAFGIAASDAQGGFTYRGYSGGAFALSLQGHAAVASDTSWGQLLVGAGLGAAAVVPGYQYTTLYFFYPEVRMEGYLDWRPAMMPDFSILISLPVRVQLRRDMAYSGSAGIGLAVAYRVGSGK